MKKRNKLVVLLLTCCMTVSMLAGCGKKTNDQNSSEPAKQEEQKEATEQKEVSEEEKFGGTLKIAMAAVASNIDPVKFTGFYEGQIIENIADTLVVYSDDLSKFEGSLATSWNQMKREMNLLLSFVMTYIFIRENIRMDVK